MIAIARPDPRIVDELCPCCQDEPDHLEIRGQCPCELLAELEEQLDARQPQSRQEVWPHVVVVASCLTIAIVCQLVGLKWMPSLWALPWFVAALASPMVAGLVIGLAITRE